MSYCAVIGGGDPNAWISVKGWTDFLNRWRGGVLQPAALSRAAAVAPRTAGALQVNASVDAAGGARILSVRPLTPRPQPGLTATPLRLVVRDAAGGVLSDVDGVVLARRDRSPNAPVGAFLSPREGQLVGRGEKLSIRWRASDRDGGPLEATLERSSRGGRPGSWRTVSIGPNGGRVALPSDYFAGSAEAALRLRINDGFNETAVLSPPFRTIHRRPVVRIVNPRAGAVLPRDAISPCSACARRAPAAGDHRRSRGLDRRAPADRARRSGGRAPERGRAPGCARSRATRRAAAARPSCACASLPSFTLLDVPARVAPLAGAVCRSGLRHPSRGGWSCRGPAGRLARAWARRRGA